MGALGPIGYPGPKGVKVSKSHPLIWVSPQPGAPWPISAQKEACLGAGLGEGVGAGRPGAHFSADLRASHRVHITDG